MKTLLLDFDGVCHPADTPALDAARFRLLDNPSLFVWLPILERLLARSEVGIVVSSDWALFCDDDSLRRLLRSLAPRFHGVVGTRHPGWSRAEEIGAYVRKHRLDDWLALDDHPSVLDACFRDPRFVWCPPARGISDPSAQEKVARWLSGEPLLDG
ncbi:MAG: HAD domain-containing protein [Casimicrobiaceae bacterium]